MKTGIAAMTRSCAAALALMALAGAQARLPAATAVFAPGLSDASGANAGYKIEATHIRADQSLTSGGALAGYNFGGAPGVELGRSHQQLSRGLIRFDLTSFAGKAAHVSRARLTLTVRSSTLDPLNASFPSTLTLRLFRVSPVNADWAAGTGDNAPQAGGASWNERLTGTAAWAGAPGCGLSGVDFEAPPLAVAVGHESLYFSGYAFVFELNDPDLMRDWADHPEHNAGFFLTAEQLEASSSDGSQVLQLQSDEAATPALRPALTVDYTPVATGDQSAADRIWLRLR